MTFVSRKDLAFIHLVPRELPAGIDVFQFLEQGFDFFPADTARGIPVEPLSEGVIERLVFTAGDLSGAIDLVFVGTKSDISHEHSVHENSVPGKTSQRCCLGSIILSPPNGNVKMSPHERKDIRVESEGTTTSERDFQLRQGRHGVRQSRRTALA